MADIGAMSAVRVAVVHDRHRVHLIRLVLLRRVMSQPDLVLIVEPVLIIGPIAGVVHPLNEPLVRSFEVLLVNFSIRPHERRHEDVAENPTSPLEQVIDVVRQKLTCSFEVLFILLGESD